MVFVGYKIIKNILYNPLVISKKVSAYEHL